MKKILKTYKHEICNSISNKTKINKDDINLIYDEIFKGIKKQLLLGKSLTITNFATLKIYKYHNTFFKECVVLKIKKSAKGWRDEPKEI